MNVFTFDINIIQNMLHRLCCFTQVLPACFSVVSDSPCLDLKIQTRQVKSCQVKSRFRQLSPVFSKIRQGDALSEMLHWDEKNNTPGTMGACRNLSPQF